MSREEYPMAYPSGHVLQLACALVPSCSDSTSYGQVSVLQCHPWISNADTTQDLKDLQQSSNHTLITSSVSKENLLQLIWLKAI